MDTKTQLDRLTELTILHRAQLKQLAEQLPGLREEIVAEFERRMDEAEPQFREELEAFAAAKTTEQVDAHALRLKSEIDDIASEAQKNISEKVTLLMAQKQAIGELIKRTKGEVKAALASVPESVQQIVGIEAEAIRTETKEQLRTHFETPRFLNPRGVWKRDEVYEKLDLVSSDGSSYVANERSRGVKPGPSKAEWTTIARRGSAGALPVTTLGEIVGTPTDGEILIGDNGNFVRASLTAGYGVNIITGPGSIEIETAGFVIFEGTWNASTNTPTLASGVGIAGHYYVVSTAGTTNLDGVTDWQPGDWAIFNGTAWEKVDNSEIITSVNGQTGVVVLTKSDVGLGNVSNDAQLKIASNLSDLNDAATARTNLGLGTIATQDDSSVTLTGGSINGTTVGATTASTGAFTNLSYTGTLTGGTDVIDIGTGQLQKDAAGNFGVGGNTTGVVSGVTVTSKFCVKNEGNAPVAGFVHVNDTTAGSGSGTFACRSRGTTSAQAVVENNDALWNMFVAGHDGTDLALAAKIAVEVDGTPGSDDMPGRVVISTTPDGTQSPVERLRITNGGNVGIGTSSPVEKLDVSGTVKATAFSGPLTGNVTGNVSGTSANVTGTVAVGNGGTGASDAATARTNLGVYSQTESNQRLAARAPRARMASDGATSSRALIAQHGAHQNVAGQAVTFVTSPFTVPTANPAGNISLAALAAGTGNPELALNGFVARVNTAGTLVIATYGATSSDNRVLGDVNFRATYSGQKGVLAIRFPEGNSATNPVIYWNGADITASFVLTTGGTPPNWMDANLVTTNFLSAYNWPASDDAPVCYLLNYDIGADEALRLSRGEPFRGRDLLGGSMVNANTGFNFGNTTVNGITSVSTGSALTLSGTASASVFYDLLLAGFFGVRRNQRVRLRFEVESTAGNVRLGFNTAVNMTGFTNFSVLVPGVYEINADFLGGAYFYTNPSGDASIVISGLDWRYFGLLDAPILQPCNATDDATRQGMSRRMLGMSTVDESPRPTHVFRADTNSSGNAQILGGPVFDAVNKFRLLKWGVNNTTGGNITLSLGSASAGTQYASGVVCPPGYTEIDLVGHLNLTNNLWVNASGAGLLKHTFTTDLL